MGIQVADGFSLKSKKPLDERLQFATVALMVATSENNLYDGCEAYVTATKKYYSYDSTNEVDETLGKWRERQSGGSETTDYLDLDNKPQVEGVTLSGNKTASDLGLAKTTDLANFITKTVDDLVNYYTKSQTYSKTEVDTIVTAIKNSRFKVVATLPTEDIKTNVIYLVPKADAESGDIKDEYINLDGTTAGWERIGSTEIDLSGYVTTTALNTALADYTTTTDLTALLANKQDKLQYSTLPTASAELEGKIVEYTGATGGGLTHGYFYECVSDGESEPTYSWQQTNVQPSSGGGTDYTAGDGIDITENVISVDPMSAEDMDEVIDELPTGGNMAVTGYVPLGTLIPFYGETAPKFFLACDGSTYNKVDYPELAKHLLSLTNNTPYIVDGDDTKFKVPDLRGEFIRGTGTNSHENQGSGADVGVHQDATAHNNFIVSPTNNRLYGYSTTKTSNQQNLNKDTEIVGVGYVRADGSWADATDQTALYTSRPTNTSVLFCIAYKDIYSNPMNDYSTDEKVVGTWIDGSPLYQRTVDVGAVSAGTDKSYSVDGWNIDSIIKLGGNGYASYGQWVEIGFPHQRITEYGVNVLYNVGTQTLVIHSGTACSLTKCYITVQYTKTTA